MAEVSSSSGTHSPSLRLREGLYERHFSKNQLTKAKTSLRKVALTTTYYWTFICYGMAIALIGPTIPVLSDSTSTPISRMGWIFTMKGIGVILGSLVGSKAFDSIYSRSHRLANFLLVAAIGLSTASLGLIPIVNNFSSMLFLYLAFGFCAGLINMGCNLLLMYSWESYVPGLIIGLTAAAGIGSTISPLLIASGLQFNSVYRLVSGLFVSSAVLLTLCQMIPSKTKYAPLEDEEITEDNEELIETDQDLFVQQRPRFSQKLKNFMLGSIVGLSLFGAVAIESSFGGLLSTFLREKGLAGTYKVNALMNSTFWLSMTFGRLLSLSASRWIGSSVLLSLSANGVFASLAILLAAPRSEIAWLGIALMGLSLSGMYPLALGYPESSMKGVNFTPAMSSAMLLMASSAELVVPAFITTTIGKVGPNALIWTLIGATGITFVSYIGMFLWSTVLKYSSSRLSRDQIPLMQADSLFESPNSPVPLSPASDFIEEKDPQHVEKPATPA